MEVLILVLTFVVLLAIGVPIAYSLGIAAMTTLLASMPSIIAFTTVAHRMANGLDSFVLLAIPFFVLAGQLMNSGGIARRLIDFAKTLVGGLPGGLSYVNIMASMLFGAISGSAVAAASAIGGFMHPRLVKEGYDPAFSAAVNITSATTGMIIPPSNILIVYSLASGGVSIAALFLAGYIPGILLGLSLMVVAGVMFVRRKNRLAAAGETPEVSMSTDEEVEEFRTPKGFQSFLEAIPSLFLLVVVIGGIVGGIFTATEASAIAVLYTAVLGFIYKEVKWADMPGILLNTVGTTSIVLLLIATSMAMSWGMSYENIPQDVSAALLSIGGGNKILVLLIINLILLFVGTFMDMTPAVLIFTPIFLPVVTELGIDPTHFGIIMVLNLCIGICTPPVGSVLFVGAAVAKLDIARIIRPLLPMFVAMVVVLMLITYIPQLSLWLPTLFGF
jgi:tripartite ATP-independent transporter DctM subunit